MNIDNAETDQFAAIRDLKPQQPRKNGPNWLARFTGTIGGVAAATGLTFVAAHGIGGTLFDRTGPSPARTNGAVVTKHDRKHHGHALTPTMPVSIVAYTNPTAKPSPVQHHHRRRKPVHHPVPTTAPTTPQPTTPAPTAPAPTPTPTPTTPVATPTPTPTTSG